MHVADDLHMINPFAAGFHWNSFVSRHFLNDMMDNKGREVAEHVGKFEFQWAPMEFHDKNRTKELKLITESLLLRQ